MIFYNLQVDDSRDPVWRVGLRRNRPIQAIPDNVLSTSGQAGDSGSLETSEALDLEDSVYEGAACGRKR